MSYSPITDFLALVRITKNGGRVARVPGLDFVMQALARSGLATVFVGAVAPVANQATTVWFKPNVPSWSGEGAVYLWNSAAGAYQPATPQLWSTFLAPATTGATPVIQDVAAVGPVGVNINTTILRVLNVGAPVTLVLPAASTKVNPVQVVDWANLAGTNNILINRTGTDVFPNGATSWTLAGDGASLLFRPVPGGYTL